MYYILLCLIISRDSFGGHTVSKLAQVIRQILHCPESGAITSQMRLEAIRIATEIESNEVALNALQKMWTPSVSEESTQGLNDCLGKLEIEMGSSNRPSNKPVNDLPLTDEEREKRRKEGAKNFSTFVI